MSEQTPQDSQPLLFLEQSEGVLFDEHESKHIEAIGRHHKSVDTLFGAVEYRLTYGIRNPKEETNYWSETNHWLTEATNDFMSVIYTSEEYRTNDQANIMRLKIELLSGATRAVNKFFEDNKIRKKAELHGPLGYQQILEDFKKKNPDCDEDHVVLVHVRELYRKVQLSV